MSSILHWSILYCVFNVINVLVFAVSFEGVRIKTRFMKNELPVFFIRKFDYASFSYVTIPL